MGSFDLLDIVVSLAYLAGTGLYFAGTFLRGRGLRRGGLASTVLGFALHTFDLGVVTSQPGNSLAEGSFYFSLLAWLIVLIYLLAWWRLRQPFLALTVSPLALLAYVSSAAFAGTRVVIPPHMGSLFFGLHIGALFLAIGLLALAFGAGIAFLYADGKIKAKEKLPGFMKDLPSLSAFDRVNAVAVSVGFPLYTIGLLSGFLWASSVWKKTFTGDPKEFISLTIWLLYAWLFHQRVIIGRQGARTAKLAIVIFLVTMFSMVVVNLFFPTHHNILNPMPLPQ